MSKKKEKKGKSNAVRNIIALRIIGGPRYFAALMRFRARADSESLGKDFHQIFRTRESLSILHGIPFPSEVGEVLRREIVAPVSSPQNEMIWASLFCAMYGEELVRFVRLRERFESALVALEGDSCQSALREIEEAFGHSVWLVQSQMAARQIFQEDNQFRQYRADILASANGNPLLRMLISLIIMKLDSSGRRAEVKKVIDEVAQDGALESVAAYLRIKLIKFDSPRVADIADALSIDSQACVIDYYETLIAMLQHVAAADIDTLRANALMPIKKLYTATNDRRLLAVLVALGETGSTITYEALDESRGAIVEAYIRAEHALVVEKARAHLRYWPEDVLVLAISTQSAISTGVEFEAIDGLLKDVSIQLRSVLSLAEDCYTSAISIIELADRYSGYAWAHTLKALVLYALREEELDFPGVLLKKLLIYSSSISPALALFSRKNRLPIATNLAKLQPTVASLINTLASGSDTSGGGAAPNPYANWALVYHYVENKNYTSPIKFLNEIRRGNDQMQRCRAASILSLCYLRTGELKQSLDSLASGFVEMPSMPTIFPLEEVVENIGASSEWPEGISLPIILNAYTEINDNERLSDLRYSFERFHLGSGIKTAQDLIKICNDLSRETLILYMNEVWRPEVMRQTLLYKNSQEIEQARIEVCRELAVLDMERSAFYLDEVKERVKRQEIRKGASLVEGAKVYVDIVAIKKILNQNLKASYAKYKAASRVGAKTQNDVIDALTEVFSDLNVVSANDGALSIANRLSKLQVLGVNLSEVDLQFSRIFDEVTTEFLHGDYGLNAYLSTRVRHGKFKNALRKAVEDERLVTEKQEITNEYKHNAYWDDCLVRLGAQDRDAVLRLLLEFSSEYDSILDCVRDEQIQIRSAVSQNNVAAMFVYVSSVLEKRFIQDYDRSLENMDELVDKCVETLWEKTDENLGLMRAELSGPVRDKVMGCFDSLENRIKHIGISGEIKDLLNSIQRARTGFQAKLSEVVGWFRRNEVYDREDYSVDLPVQIALSILSRTVSVASGWDGVVINASGSPNMPGMTLDGLVDVYYDLLANAVLRSGVEVADLCVSIDISFEGGEYLAKVSNPLGPALPTARDRERVAHAQEALRKRDTRRKAQIEGGSGLYKIWKTLNSSFYRDAVFDFGYNGNTFGVEFRFRIVDRDDENIAR